MSSVLILGPDGRRSKGEAPEMDEQHLGERLARLESDVKHVQTDVSDIKVELRRTNDKIDSLETKFEAKFDSIRAVLDAMRADAASTKIWALGLYIALASTLLFVMAKGFKWL
jgi:outer membrane murein-binding lipoprotein Lpp